MPGREGGEGQGRLLLLQADGRVIHPARPRQACGWASQPLHALRSASSLLGVDAEMLGLGAVAGDRMRALPFVGTEHVPAYKTLHRAAMHAQSPDIVIRIRFGLSQAKM